MPKVNDIYESDGGKTLNVSGDNFTMEFDATDGTMYVRMSGAMVTSYRDLTVYDYFARFAKDYDENTQGRIINWLEKHEDAFIDNVMLHELRGDTQQRFRIDGYTYDEEARRIAVDWLERYELDFPGIEDDFVDFIAEDLIFEVSESDALDQALEDVEEEMHEEAKRHGFEELVDRDWMMELRERFRNDFYAQMSTVNYDMWAMFDEFIEDEKGGFTQYRVRHRKDRWEVVNQDKMQKPIKIGGKREVAKKARSMADNNTPAVVYIEKKGEAGLEDAKLVME